MTVLVDEAMWWWRQRRWAHLVSDESHEELHEFARRLGKRRLGFQGDHYDVDATDRERALVEGALPVDSRELVRRLRAAGLRNRGAKPRWEELARWDAGQPTPVSDVGQTLRPLGTAGARLAAAFALHTPLSRRAAVGIYVDPDHVVALLDLPPGATTPGEVAVDVDLHVVSGPRADETSSIELFVRR